MELTMIRRIGLVLALIFSGAAAHGRTKEYTILGGQTIKAEVRDGMPLPAQKAGVVIEGAGFALGEGKLIWSFDFTSQTTPTRVVIEDVSGQNAQLLVNDATPKLDGDHHWSGEAAPLVLSRKDCPWLFESGDTTKVFRFSVTLLGKSEPVVIFQPAIYSAETKQQIRQMAQ